MHGLLVAVGMLALATAAAPAMAQGGSDLSIRLAETLEAFRERHAFPGATAAIALPDGTVVSAASGLADRERGRPMTPETPMLAASISKTFVAATVLALEHEGALSQAYRLAEHLGDRAWFDALPNAATVTLGQLLRHTGGLPDHVHLPAFQDAWARLGMGEGRFDPEALVAFVLGQAPLFEAGTAWAYSDTGYVLLGLVIEAVTGDTWYEAVRERFLDPLGLSATVPSDRPDLAGLAVGYVAPDNPFGMPERTADAHGRLLWNPAVESAGGGFASTSGDLARWGQLLFAGAAMPNPYLEQLLASVPVDPDTPGIRYGAGVAIHADTSHGTVYGHGGWIPGYVSSLRHYADHGVTVAFQLNSDAGFLDASSDLVAGLEAALAELAIEVGR
ncbi:MAG: beta-lactamase family protein [Gammaproteobacteria bacterium]|nr:beta-lactamase family protein [Gammaproteobacteria bacterium]TVQ50442.1 MAG: class A beta-lactamase-related serine hydrolase [Gammaproteobacteria bacterium]